jgi:hypothetical protein
MADLSDFMISKVRVKMLELFFSQPTEMWYVREITRLVSEEINAVRRELERLTETGILKMENRANRKYYTLNPSYEFYSDLLKIVAKTTGLGKNIKRNKNKLGNVEYVMFTGKFAKKERRSNDEVDMLIVGDVVLPEIAQLVREEEKGRGREINYTVMSLEEFEFRKTRRDPFLLGILELPRVMILGEEERMLERKPAQLP